MVILCYHMITESTRVNYNYGAIFTLINKQTVKKILQIVHFTSQIV